MVLDVTSAVLVVEDDPDAAAVMVRALDRAGYAVTHIATGNGAAAHVSKHRPAAVILDLGLPDIDGLEVCRRIRAAGYAGGVIVVTARVSEADVVLSVEAGADDYLAKPFGLAELLARVRAVMDRPFRYEATSHLDAGSGLRIAPAARRLMQDGVEIPLTRAEFDVFAALLTSGGKVVPYDTLAAQAGLAVDSRSRKALDRTLRRLDEKLETFGAAERVVVVHGTGARLDESSSDPARGMPLPP